MSKFYTNLGHFLIGISDSLSTKWIKGVLFYTDPRKGITHQESKGLQKTLLQSVIQAGFVTGLLPIVLRLLGLEIISWIVMGLSLIFTYGYLTFYNMDVTSHAMQVIAWKTKNYPNTMPELDVRQRINIITDINSQIQAFIFEMVYYTPMNLLLMIFTLFDQTYFPWVMVIMDCFFNTAFYYFRKWPYDKYNVIFLQKHMSYCLGFGLFVSILANIILPPSLSITGFLLASQWMIVNAICHSPPQVEFNSFAEIWKVLTNSNQRRKLRSSYNIHRRQLKNLQYRKKLMKQCYYMKSFFTLTDKINFWIRNYIMQKPVQKQRFDDEQGAPAQNSPKKEQASTPQQLPQIQEQQQNGDETVVLRLNSLKSQ